MQLCLLPALVAILKQQGISEDANTQSSACANITNVAIHHEHVT